MFGTADAEELRFLTLPDVAGGTQFKLSSPAATVEIDLDEDGVGDGDRRKIDPSPRRSSATRADLRSRTPVLAMVLLSVKTEPGDGGLTVAGVACLPTKGSLSLGIPDGRTARTLS